ncbi:hypothetical protein NFI96_031868 [Prochilodus magdalenae]|nr:hypothetical protein NFI96_031868 [Prochilodus magdalenae]
MASSYMVYASTDSLRRFECGDIGHKHFACPLKDWAGLLYLGRAQLGWSGGHRGEKDWWRWWTDLASKQKELAAILHEKMNDMDAPTAFLFDWERSMAGHQALVVAQTLDPSCCGALSSGLPQLDQGRSQALDAALSFEEVTEVVFQLNSGRAPGIDGLPVYFFKAFWGVIGEDLFSVLQHNEVFWVRRSFLSWVRLLYTDASCLIKVGGGFQLDGA